MLIESQTAKLDRAALADLYVRLAEIYTSLKLLGEAETAYRRAAETEPSHYSQWAAWVAAQGRGEEAVKLCLDRAKDDPSAKPAIALAAALAAAKSPPENRGRAELLISQALKSFPNDRELLFTVAAWRSMSGENRQAIELLRLNLQLDPQDAATLNNLAMVLCETPGGADEALSCVDRAMEAIGNRPELLDTRGWVLLRQARHEQAEAAFRDAMFSEPGSSRFRFHLALSLHGQGKSVAAREALEQAKHDGLDAELLSPAERVALAGLAGGRE
jgi:Tfp pilus assembly protein PilF